MHRIWVLRHFAFISSFRIATKQRRFFCSQTPSTSFASEAAVKYEKKSPTEHVLLRPDTYIGGVAMRESEIVWLRSLESKQMYTKEVSYPPGLLKIFDEILVNAADNKSRDSNMNRLEVWVDRKTSRISVWNNGGGLPVEIHPSENIYVPTLVFGNLFTSSNYDDSEIKTVGGRNGYGAKLCNIFSTEFIVETVDSRTKKKFRQVEFVPDLKRFQMDCLSDDIIDLIGKRIFEVTATLPNDVQVYLNGQKCEVNGFEEYVRMFNYYDPSSFLFLHPTSRWHVGVAKRNTYIGDDQLILPKVVSFVNNINTEKGGTHVDYVMDKIVNVIKPLVDSRLAEFGKSVKPAMIKNNLSIFINCLIENPSFESQTKETVTTKPKLFGSSFDCDHKKVTKWAEESGFVEEIVEEALNLKKKKVPAKRVTSSSVRDIVKLEDAEWAGISGKSEKCTLILTEGDSAKALALSGLEVLGRETYGVFPLKGKLVNVSNIDDVRASKNEEISNVMRILGLRFEEEAPTQESMRYGRLLILADQDEDGSHIKGLVINFIHKFWPSLIRSRDFIQSFRTPLLKAKKGDKVKSFFSINEYQKWAEETEGKWKIKYYKGLGTSTSIEAKEYFSDLDHHVINFKYTGLNDDKAIRMAFDREKSDERKEWIRGSKRLESLVDDGKTELSYKEFIDGQLMQFGMVDLKRSIPSLIDGLKPSQRKILWTLLNMDESTEMKVSQLAGAVAHRQSYHHGEESLVRTIIRMGQTFCGSSNLPLLQPIGQFGTRHEGGNDAASARYIFTSLASTTRLLFPHADDDLYEKRIEEGLVVEPRWLCPIIPLILVNGTEGIGTGWSTKIVNRNAIDVIDGIRRKIDSVEGEHEIQPYYEDYRGKIEAVTSKKFITTGKIHLSRPERKNASTFSIEISELPIEIWTSKYKEKLSKIVENLPIVEFSERHTEKRVNFRLTVDRKKAGRFLQKTNSELLNFFKLRSSITENRVLFDKNGLLKEYKSISEIASEFFDVRRDLYEKRLKAQKDECEAKLKYVDNQIKFIDLVTNGTIDLRSMGRDQLESSLEEYGLESDPLSSKTHNAKKSDYSYLLEMPLSRLTSDEMNRLTERRFRRKTDLDAAESADWRSTWHSELDKVTTAIQKKINK
ncbi:hypothetical protein GCK72_010166 [Caenorhabditis remanei]|uniref:DNA topoisomerase 2 n=1 Tax=Caenorhabditis remanei TaxID=31234 RepID=A0A6A5H3X0_CAERE|nr:hypothetical protein GCK72_010166 [Caenorhabditis remanei]KAF1761907.1 hypothetical protein GCK72_010166 [Caenorhabditis remanei]